MVGIPVVSDDTARLVIRQFVKDAVDSKSNVYDEKTLSDTVGPELFVELLRYLYLKISTKSIVGPCSKSVDMMWHAFVLCTKQYKQFCDDENDGQFLHHDPSLFVSGTASGAVAYYQTLSLYVRRYKEEPSMEYWPRSRAGEELVQSALKEVIASMETSEEGGEE